MGRITAVLLLSFLLLDAKEWKLHIEGMHCISCTLAVKKALLSVSGVREAKVNFKKESAFVTTDENVTLREMQHSIAQTGYAATP
ncbi:MAG: heavy-metal-associated domain-containing protein [Sulfuricurvum sp.]